MKQYRVNSGFVIAGDPADSKRHEIATFRCYLVQLIPLFLAVT